MTSNQQSSNEVHIWPALLDVIIATLMIILLFMIIQYISFYLSDALARIELRDRQNQLVEMVNGLVQWYCYRTKKLLSKWLNREA